MCVFEAETVEFVGLVISNRKVEMDEVKVAGSDHEGLATTEVSP